MDTGIGSLDNGVIKHDDLDANLTTGRNVVDENSNTVDIHSHGTRTAGIIGAVGNNGTGTVGVNWNVTLVPIRISTRDDGDAYRKDAIKGITWATNNNIHVLNFSYSGYKDSITSYDTALTNYPGLFVWSAGNQTANIPDSPNVELSEKLNIIAVGAIKRSGQWAGFSNYSSTGNSVHIYAPGEEGFTTSLNNGYATYSGTSMAAPFVSGVAALMLSVNPNLKARELRSLILENSDLIQISIPGNPEQTVRKLNAYKAVLAAAPFAVYDLEPTSVTGPTKANINTSVSYTIRVTHNGHYEVNGSSYIVQFRRGSLVLETKQGVTLQPGEYHDFIFNWVPTQIGIYDIHGFVEFSKDQIPSNNLSKALKLVVQNNIISITPADNIRTSISLVSEGGTLLMSGGFYNQSQTIPINDRKISIIGSDDSSNPTVLTGYFEIYDVGELTKIENITFMPDSSYMYYMYSWILLNNATPTLNNLVFNIDDHPMLRSAISANYTNTSVVRLLSINNSVFNGGRGIDFNAYYGNAILYVNNSVFNKNVIKFGSVGNGNAINFDGARVYIENSLFLQETGLFSNMTPRTMHTVSITLYETSYSDNAVAIKNNEFITLTSHSNFYAHDIYIQGQPNNHVNLERNVFHTKRLNSTVTPISRIILEDVDNFKLINNTDFFEVSASTGYSTIYDFVNHNGIMLAKNNLITGDIKSTPNAINQIYYSHFIRSDVSLPTNSVISNNSYGDPFINTTTLEPRLMWL